MGLALNAQSATSTGHAAIFGHPRGLKILCFTEAWEQFSYYGMRALLVYYMIQTLGFSQPAASIVFASYVSAAYFTPILGGIITDRWLGRRRAVTIGATIMAIGHFLMAFEPLLYVALATIAIGNGLYVPSLASQISGLYQANDPRRHSAFNVYYVAGNVGGFLAPLSCGLIGELFGWHYGFSLAGVGMLVGLIVYLRGEKYLVDLGSQAVPHFETADDRGDERRRFLALGAVLFAVILFRGAYEQLGNTVALFVQEANRAVGERTIPMTWFQSLNALMVIAFTPALLAWWQARERRNGAASTAARMALGAALVGTSYLLLAAVGALSEASGNAPHWFWLVAFFAILTMGELYILPVGLGLFCRLAPRRLAATTVSIWFAAISLGSLLSGFLGALWSVLSVSSFFAVIGGVAFAASMLCLGLRGFVQRVEHDDPQRRASTSKAFGENFA